MERAKVFQIWLSGSRARFVKQKLLRDFGTASYIYIYIYINSRLYVIGVVRWCDVVVMLL